MGTRSQATSTTDLEITETLCELNKVKLNGTLDEKKKQKSDKDKEDENASIPVNIFKLFRFARGLEKILVILGILAAWAAGVCMPIMIILFGRVTNSMVNYVGMNQVSSCLPSNQSKIQVIYKNQTFLPTGTETNSSKFDNLDEDEFYFEITLFGVGLAVVGAGQMLLSYLMVSCLNAAAERQVFRIRSLFLQSVLRQDIGWYDTHRTGEFASRTAEDLTKFQDGIGEKIGMFNFFFSIFTCSVINAFIHGWELTLVTLSVAPVLIIAGSILGKMQASLAENELRAYAASGSIAEEVLTAIRTVVAFGGEAKEVERYDNRLVFATRAGIKRGLLTGLGAGTLWCIIYSSYGLAFWYGVKLILEERGDPDATYNSSTLLIVFFSVLMGAMNIGQSAPYVDAISQARAAAANIFDIIDRIPPIDSSSEAGRRPYDIIGNIEFENVYFHYPSRPDVQILSGLSLKINTGETVALVGESGCGKSTLVQLMQRFYDPLHGTVSLDECDIKHLNLGWLRDQIGIVGQEPVLFGTTIADNIRYGRENATQYDIEMAARAANAHDFIMKLPKKYQTQVGDRGTQLSGGQKQRVAIARALIKNPRILLLDEATSALDSKSEAVVQEALDKARKGRTTIIVAHRLSTVRTADKIAVVSKGRIAELGTHSELMDRKGIYYLLITTQSGDDSESDNENEMEPDEIKLENHPMLKYQRSLSIRSDQSVEEILHRVSVALNRTPSLRCKRCQSPIWSEEDEENEKTISPPFMKILMQNKPEWKFIAAGCFGSLIMGISSPGYALVFGEILQVLTNCDDEKVMSETIFYSLMFLVIGAGTGIANFLQVFMFAYAGEYLTRRLRRLTFAAMLRQEIGWFDDPENSVGALCTRLSGDAANVQGATGSKIGTILQSICTLGVAAVIALILKWKLSLVGMLFIPIVLAGSYFQCKVIMGQSAIEMKALDKANKIAIEVISNIRTVASLHKEKTFHDLYMQHLEEPHKKALRNAHSRGFVFGFAQSTPYFAYAATIFYGGYLVLYEGMDVGSIFKVSELLLFGTMMVGQAFAFAPNANKGVVSAARIFKLLERKPLIDSSLDSGLKLPENTAGQVEFKHVKFHYPSRPDIQVLRALNLKVNSGQVLALVGSSGCGKSTCIQLLERFYDPRSGLVMMDGTDIGQLNIGWLRSRIGIVSQEPILFDCSIADNIAYGDNSRKVPMDEIVKAAMSANIHNFISALPQGYETFVGDKGSQLSGGQKQRIAIARALVRNPKILLLDEATSALDNESEKVVQEALDKAQKGRTCITVAHRLTTIKDADLIAVIDQGRVVELGTHDTLLAKKGHYFKFYETQSKGH